MGITDRLILAGNLAELYSLTEPLRKKQELTENAIARIDEILAEMGLKIKYRTIFEEIYVIFEKIDTIHDEYLSHSDLADMYIHYSPRLIYAGVSKPNVFLDLLKKSLLKSMEHRPDVIALVIDVTRVALDKAKNSQSAIIQWIQTLDRVETEGYDRQQYLDTYYDNVPDEYKPAWYFGLWEGDEGEGDEDTDPEPTLTPSGAKHDPA